MEGIKINMPQAAREILDILEKNGDEAFIVGGCVRDSIMGRDPKDWDITTSASPEEVKAVFALQADFHTVDTGIQHGTVTVIKEHIGYEVTTYRIDGEYTDNRHPDSVLFTKNIKEDLARRDFTVNAIAYSPKQGFVDPFDGREDIKAKLIRGVGNAADRFDEDALRVMRAIRFSAQLGFEIEKNTYSAIFEKAALVKNISIERIREEFTKTLLSERPDRIKLLEKTGILEIFMPGVIFDTDSRSDMLAECSGKLPVRLALVIVNSHFNDVNKLLKKLTYDNDTAKTTALILKYSDMPVKTRYDIRLLINKAGAEGAKLVLYFMLANNDISREEYKNAENLREDIINSGECCSIKQLAVTGEDLQNAGIPRGKMIGQLLDKALDTVLKDPMINTREDLLDILLKKDAGV